MAHIASKTLYLDDRGEVVGEDDPGARVLLARRGTVVPDDMVRQYEDALGKSAKAESDRERTERLLADAEERGALYEAEGHRSALDRMEVEERVKERAEKRRGARRASDEDVESKAVAGPPENKAAGEPKKA